MSYKKLFLTFFFLSMAFSLFAQKGLSNSQETKQSLKLKLAGYAQMGYSATFTPSEKPTNSFNINKVELLLLGNITKHWDMGVIVQLNSPVQLKELYTGYEFIPELKLRIGQFKTPFGLENQIPPFLNDLIIGGSNPTLYFAGIAGDPRYMGTGGRDIGFELSGKVFNGKLSYNFVAMNGAGINRLSSINPKMYGISIELNPIQDLRLKVSYLGGVMKAMSIPVTKRLRSADENSLSKFTIDPNYTRNRASIGGQWKSNIVNILAEYMYGYDINTLISAPSRNNSVTEKKIVKNKVFSQGAYFTTAFHLPKRYDIVVAGDYLCRDNSQSNDIYTATIGLQKWFWGACRWQVEYQYRHLNGNIPFLGINTPGHRVAAQVQFAF